MDQSEQAFAVHEPDRLPRGEPPSFLGEVARGDDDGLVRALGREHAVDPPHHPDADAAAAPVLALHEVEFAVPAQPDVDSAVRSGLLVPEHAVAIASVCFGHQLLELAPRKHADGVESPSGGREDTACAGRRRTKPRRSGGTGGESRGEEGEDGRESGTKGLSPRMAGGFGLANGE